MSGHRHLIEFESEDGSLYMTVRTPYCPREGEVIQLWPREAPKGVSALVTRVTFSYGNDEHGEWSTVHVMVERVDAQSSAS